MRLPQRLFPALASLFLFAAAADAQLGGPHSGTTSSLALAFSIADPEAATIEEVFVKPPLSAGPVVPATPSNSLEERAYPLSQLAGVYSPVIRYAAYSSGCSEIPGRLLNGAPDMATSQNWMLAVLSVSDETEGSEGSMIVQRRSFTAQRNTPGADLYGFYMTHSIGLSGSLRGKTKLEMHAEGLGLGTKGDVQAFDYGMGVITHGHTDPQFVFFSNTSNFYFALDASCLPVVNAIAGPTGFADGLPAVTSTIYRQTWNSASGTWDPPQIYRDAVELGIPAAAEIDALALDPVRDTIVFSVKKGLGLPQLLFYDPTYPNTSVEFSDGDGIAVTEKVGVGSNDSTEEVDGVDILDPHEGIIGKFYGTATGVATDDIKSDLGVLGLSMTRAQDSTDASPELHFQASGWGGAPPADGFVVFEFVDPITALPDDKLLVDNYRFLGAVVRSPRDYEVDYSIPVPLGYVSSAMGVKATALDLNLGTVATSWAMKFQLF